MTDDKTADNAYEAYTGYYNHSETATETETKNSMEQETAGAPDQVSSPHPTVETGQHRSNTSPSYDAFNFAEHESDPESSPRPFGMYGYDYSSPPVARSLAPFSYEQIHANLGNMWTTASLSPTPDTVAPELAVAPEMVAPELNGLFALQRSHFRSTEPVETIVDTLSTALETEHVLDAVVFFDETKFKFECSVQTPHDFTWARVNVFRDNDEHIVEVQKIRGSSVSFHWVWRRLLTHPEIEGLQTVPRVPASALAEPAMDVHLKEEIHLQPIIQMVTSMLSDVKREGLTTLSRIIDSGEHSGENARLLLRRNMREVVNQLEAECLLCRIFAARIVAQVCKAVYSSRSPALGQAIRPLIAAMNVATTNVEVAELQRQSCIALRELAKGTFPLEIFEQGGATALSRHQESDIAVLAREAQRTMSAIRTQSS